MTTEEKLDKAWDFFNEGNYEESLKIASVIRKVQNYSHLGNYLLGHIAFAKKEFDDSIVYFIDALNSTSGNRIGGFVNYWIGKIYEYTEVWSGDDNPLYDKEKALEAFKQALKYDKYPEDTITRITYLVKSDEQKQIYFEAGIEKHPHYLEYYISLSKLFQKLEYPSKQIETLLSALPNVKKSSALYFSIALFYYENTEFVLSEKYYLECIELLDSSTNPNNIYYALGCCYQKEGKYNLAIDYFKKHNENNYKHEHSWYSTLSLIFCFDQKKEDAEIVSILSNLPFERDLFENITVEYGLPIYLDEYLAEVLNFAQDEDEICKILERFLKSNKDSKFKLKVCLIISELKRYKENYFVSLTFLRDAIKYSNKEKFILGQLPWLYENALDDEKIEAEIFDFFISDSLSYFFDQTSNKKLAKLVISKAFTLKRYEKVIEVCKLFSDKELEDIDACFYYAYALKDGNKASDSKYYYEKYLQKNPKSSAALNNLGVTYQDQKDYSKAIKLFKEAIKYDNTSELYQRNLKNATDNLSKQIKEEKQKRIPENWSKSIKEISIKKLEGFEYFDIIARIESVSKKYRKLIERDFKELVFNNLVGNYKSTVVMSGSLVELILTYYCEKKRIRTLQLKDSKGNMHNKKLYDCVLNDLITFVGDKNLFGNDFHHLGSLARIYRNFIHPGLEIKMEAEIKPKAELCFLSTIELLKKIL